MFGYLPLSEKQALVMARDALLFQHKHTLPQHKAQMDKIMLSIVKLEELINKCESKGIRFNNIPQAANEHWA